MLRLGAALATLGVAALVAGCGGAPSNGGGAAGPVMSGARTGTGLLVDENGQPAAVTAEIGGYLGVGQKIVVIGLDRLQLRGDDEPDLATTYTKEELQGMQAWPGQ